MRTSIQFNFVYKQFDQYKYCYDQMYANDFGVTPNKHRPPAECFGQYKHLQLYPVYFVLFSKALF